ncbi:MAG TPA: hypothetical protein VF062_27355 [Candidatus Limnocylindrales bacterium]
MREKDPWAPPAWAGEPSTTQAPPDLSSTEPFSLPAQEVPRDAWFERPPRPTTQKPPRRYRQPRSLAIALPLIILLGFISAFFSWVSAEPLWLAVGHGSHGTATVTRCIGDGMTRRCVGDFTGPDFAVTRISLLGVTEASTAPGQQIAAEMVNARSHRAYAGGSFVLRWLPGLALVLLCGLGIALAAGVRRFADRRERRAALAVSLAAPVLVTIGFLAAAF